MVDGIRASSACRSTTARCSRRERAEVRSNRVDQPAGAGHDREVMVGVAEERVDHARALEIVADLVLHGYADAAVELDRLLTHKARGAADLDLGGGDHPP